MHLEKNGLQLIRVKEDDIELIRNWRNSSKIANTMIFREHITKEMQRDWFKRIDNESNFYFLIVVDSLKVGLINIKDINHKKKCGEWGIFIFEDEYIGGVCPILAAFTFLDFLFFELRLKTVFSSILENNKKAIRFNSMFGFKLNVTQEKNKILEYQLNLQDYLASRQKYKRIIN